MDLFCYWFEFDLPAGVADPALADGCGVTAFSYDDAVHLLREVVFNKGEVPPMKNTLEKFVPMDSGKKISRQSLRLARFRGVWHPPGYSTYNSRVPLPERS